MKNILMLAHDDAGQEARFQAALDITRAVEGHLTCADVAILPALVGDYYSTMGEAVLIADERDREAANRDRLEGRLAHEDIQWSWLEMTGDIAPCITDAAGLSDLIILNRKLDSFTTPDMRGAAEEILLRSDKPLLVVPEDANGIRLNGRVIVAWDGSPQASAALRAAVPLLKLAISVILLEIDDGSVKTPAEEAASYLSRHGIRPIIRRETAVGQGAAAVLLKETSSRAIDYVVMGGMSHGRLIEALIGGVTHKMLSESPVPVFMAH